MDINYIDNFPIILVKAHVDSTSYNMDHAKLFLKAEGSSLFLILYYVKTLDFLPNACISFQQAHQAHQQK